MKVYYDRDANPDALRGRRNAKGAALGPERYASLSHGKLIAQLFEDLAEHTYWDPTFIIDYPTEVSPLSKARPNDATITERFELYVAGMESSRYQATFGKRLLHLQVTGYRGQPISFVTAVGRLLATVVGSVSLVNVIFLFFGGERTQLLQDWFTRTIVVNA